VGDEARRTKKPGGAAVPHEEPADSRARRVARLICGTCGSLVQLLR
jgi:hypothetical protein